MISNMLFEKNYKKSPSLKSDLCGLLTVLGILTLLIWIAATKGFHHPFDYDFFAKRMAPIYSLFGTVCLAYEFFTAIRNESNKNRLNQQLIKAMEHRESVSIGFTVEKDKEARLKELNEEISNLKTDLDHEMFYVRRKYFIGWLGIILAIISTLLQLP